MEAPLGVSSAQEHESCAVRMKEDIMYALKCEYRVLKQPFEKTAARTSIHQSIQHSTSASTECVSS